MRGIKIFSTSTGHFSKKEIKRKKLEEKKRLKSQQKILKRRFFEEEKKRKLVNKLKKTHSKKTQEIQKKELEKIQEKKEKKQERKELKKIIETKITVKKPTLLELENHLMKLSDEYDQGIHKSKKLHKELIFLGLTDNGLKEFHKESERKRKIRIQKINKVHTSLIHTLETNKELEERIEIIDEQIKKEQYK